MDGWNLANHMDLNDGWSPQALRNDWPKKCGCLFQGWHVSEHHANHLNLTPTQNSQDHSVKKINKPIMFFEMNLIGLRSPMISHGSLAFSLLCRCLELLILTSGSVGHPRKSGQIPVQVAVPPILK